jgi:hypothetical protein
MRTRVPIAQRLLGPVLRDRVRFTRQKQGTGLGFDGTLTPISGQCSRGSCRQDRLVWRPHRDSVPLARFAEACRKQERPLADVNDRPTRGNWRPRCPPVGTRSCRGSVKSTGFGQAA